MKQQFLALVMFFVLTLLPARAQEALVITPLAEKKVTELPEGELYWAIENFGTRAQADAAAVKWSLVTEAYGKVWLFTLGSKNHPSTGGTYVAEVGPIERITAGEYLLRINDASGPPGSLTPVHTHPGCEAFCVLSGEQSIRTAHGVQTVRAGEPEAGHGPGMVMQVSSSGKEDLHALVMFVVDASKPFSSPASFE